MTKEDHSSPYKELGVSPHARRRRRYVPHNPAEKITRADLISLKKSNHNHQFTDMDLRARKLYVPDGKGYDRCRKCKKPRFQVELEKCQGR